MLKSSRFGLNYLAQHQINKDVIINDNFDKIDSLIWCSFKDIELNQPPTDPADGDAYIIPNNATGDWSSKGKQTAFFRNQTTGWEYYAPKAGYSFYINNKNSYYAFNGADWFEVITGAPSQNPSQSATTDKLDKLGIKDSASEYNKLTVNSKGTLLHNSEDVFLQISRGDEAKSAAMLLSNNFINRAIIGLLNSNDLQINVSEDGQNFQEGILIQPSGKVSLQNGCYIKGGVQFEGCDQLLSQHKTGVWTPTINASSGGGGTNSYTNQSGSFVKIGKLVFLNLLLECAGANGTGAALIEGIPFRPDGSSLFFGSAITYGITSLSQGEIVNTIGFTDQTSKLYIWKSSNTGSSQLGTSNIGQNFSIKGSIVYLADQ